MPELSRARPTTLLALAAVTLLACGLAASTWHVYGHTWDEPEHIAAGLSLLDQGRYQYDIQHPPIARVMLALGPYLAGARSHGTPPPDGKPEGIAILYDGGHYDRYLTLARAGALPFLALLVVMTFVWGRRLTGDAGGLVAALATATTPVVLGHGALAALDVPAAATALLALYATQAWFETGRLRAALGLGLTLGLAIGTKLSAIPFCGLGALVLLGLRVWDYRGRADARAPVTPATWVAGAALIAVLVVAILTVAYGGRFVYLTDPNHHYNQALGYLFGYVGPLHDAAYSLFERFRVPEAFQLIVGGIQALTVHNHNGHLSYLLGDQRSTGWWYFYLVALAVKTPLPLLVLGTVGLGLLARAGLAARDARQLALPAIAIALLGFASVFSHINIGVRHVIILYPLLAIGAAVALGAAWRVLARARPGAARNAGVAALGALCAIELAALGGWPDYLPYFNVLVPVPERVLVDSDLDWGQDFRRLTRRLRELQVPSVSLAYLGTADLAREDLPPTVLLNPGQRATGWVAVSALARVHAPGGFTWIDAYPVREHIGTTIDLYLIPPGSP